MSASLGKPPVDGGESKEGSSLGHTMRCGEQKVQGGLGYQTETRRSHPRVRTK